MMGVKPILFSGSMVRALLEGRKSQTRRVLKPQPWFNTDGEFGQRTGWLINIARRGTPVNVSLSRFASGEAGKLPHTPGDVLWVREALDMGHKSGGKAHGCPICTCTYQADVAPVDLTPIGAAQWAGERQRNSIPSIHMPRWASRLTLEVTEVRVERVQDISEADAKWEGLACVTKDGRLNKYGIPDSDGLPGTDNHGWAWQDWRIEARQAFRTLWNSLNEKRGYGWDANPWVSVTAFRVHHQNVDAFLAEREAA